MRDTALPAAPPAREAIDEIDHGAAAPGPWSVKGIDEETREIARAAARAAGVPVGQWIDQTIRRAATKGEVATAADNASIEWAAADQADLADPPVPPSACTVTMRLSAAPNTSSCTARS